MSRSYKKTPYCGDCKGKSSKRAANSKVRAVLKQNPDAITSGRAYRKLYDSWEICDYQWSEFKEDVISNFESSQKDKAHNVDNFTHPHYYDTLEEALINWKKDYLCK